MKRFVLSLSAIGLIAAGICAAGPTKPPATSAPSGIPDLGIGADMHGAKLFPPNDLWNTDISKAPVDPNSDALIKEIGIDKRLHPDFGTHGSGIPYIVVDNTQRKISVKFKWPQQSDAGLYPIPLNAPIEGGGGNEGDRHVLVINKDSGLLYEMWESIKVGESWTATNGAIFNLGKNSMQRPDGMTSADAAGLPIFPGLVRYDEVMNLKKIEHAIRFTVRESRKAYIPPARHQAGKSNAATLPPMGMRVRLKADYDISAFPDMDKVILTALKTYGMILADNGSDWYISGAPDDRWDDLRIGRLSEIEGKDFEVIRMGR